MKKHKINQIGEGSNTYSVYENPNKELKKQISEFQPDLSEIEMGWPPLKWTIVEQDGDEYKCQSGRDIKYFKVDDVNKAIEEQKEKQRNKQFLAFEHFKPCFGIISYYKKNDDLKILDLTKGMSTGALVGMNTNIDTMSVEAYFSEFNYEIKTYSEIALDINVYGQNMKLHFTPEGDFTNRDYNIRLDEYEQKIISPTVILQDLKELMQSAVGNSFEYANGKFFTNRMCVLPFNYAKDEDEDGSNMFGIKIAKIRNDGKTFQIETGCTIHKKPVKTEEKTFEDLWNYILNELTPFQKCLIGDNFQEFQNHLK